MYADMQRNARYSEVLHGNQVLEQQERKNKLTTRFEPSPYTVVNRHGNSLIVQSPGGAQYSRNASHVKKLLENGDTHNDTPSVDRNALHSFSFVYCSCARVLIVVKFCVRFLCVIA